MQDTLESVPTTLQKRNATNILNKLLEERLITRDQLDVVLKERNAGRNSEDITSILLRMGFVSDMTLAGLLSSMTNTKNVNIKSILVNQELMRRIPKEFALQHRVVAVDSDEAAVFVATFDVFNILIVDQLRRFLPANLKIQLFYASEADILETIEKYYDYDMSIDGILREIENIGGEIDNRQAISGDYRSPMVRLVDTILADAVNNGASDLHFEPGNFFLRLRYRIDGKMEQIKAFHKDYWDAMLVRLKIIAGMNIAETRKAQDGRINTRISGRNIDFRVSSQPTIDGENIVIRILDEKQAIFDLDSLGYLSNVQDTIKKCIKKPEGMIIITGPTGSGKTTTLYTILSMINTIEKNIMTLEEPVEYRLPLVRQTNINVDIGLDFAGGVRTILRQDPDVILVGEIRDRETANTAIQAAMTGHQVFSSLHTNDAYSAIPRLMQIGIDPFLLASSLTAIIAQRLTRKLCDFCKEKYKITEQEKEIMQRVFSKEEVAKIEYLYRPTGCKMCRGNGYRGRMSVSEIIVVDREIAEMIAHSTTKNKIMEYLEKTDFMPMQVDGLKKVASGLTTIEELSRVLDMSEVM
ncbi:type II secretion system protein E [Bacilli bacterium]|nr:type II secretion system protein E [Bacilli bacterium]